MRKDGHYRTGGGQVRRAVASVWPMAGTPDGNGPDLSAEDALKPTSIGTEMALTRCQ